MIDLVVPVKLIKTASEVMGYFHGECLAHINSHYFTVEACSHDMGAMLSYPLEFDGDPKHIPLACFTSLGLLVGYLPDTDQIHLHLSEKMVEVTRKYSDITTTIRLPNRKIRTMPAFPLSTPLEHSATVPGVELKRIINMCNRFSAVMFDFSHEDLAIGVETVAGESVYTRFRGIVKTTENREDHRRIVFDGLIDMQLLRAISRFIPDTDIKLCLASGSDRMFLIFKQNSIRFRWFIQPEEGVV